MTVVTRSEFARLMGVNKGTVTRWAQGGKLVLASGLVDVEASRQRLADTGGARPDVAERHAEARGAAVPIGRPEAPTAHSDSGSDKIGSSYQTARAVKEKYLALKAKNDYEQQIGEMVKWEDVTYTVNAAYAAMMSILDVMPDQLAPVTGSHDGLEDRHAVLSEWVRHFRAASAEEIKKLNRNA